MCFFHSLALHNSSGWSCVGRLSWSMTTTLIPGNCFLMCLGLYNARIVWSIMLRARNEYVQRHVPYFFLAEYVNLYIITPMQIEKCKTSFLWNRAHAEFRCRAYPVVRGTEERGELLRVHIWRNCLDQSCIKHGTSCESTGTRYSIPYSATKTRLGRFPGEENNLKRHVLCKINHSNGRTHS